MANTKRTPLVERFWRFVSPEPNSGCWLWTGNLTGGGGGYGYICTGGKYGPQKRAHVLSYEITHGPVPDGLELDHLCRVTCCVNPRHLEAVPHQVNCQRGEGGLKSAKIQQSITHCPKGHAYDEANTRRYRGKRICIQCQLAHGRSGKEKHYRRYHELHPDAPTGRGSHQKAKTHCPKGHEYTLANTSIGKNGGRSCRKCHAEAGRVRRAGGRLGSLSNCGSRL